MGGRSVGGGGIRGAVMGEMDGGDVPGIGADCGGDLGLLDDVFEDALEVGGGGGGEENIATSGIGVLEVSDAEGAIGGGGNGGDGTDMEVMDFENVGGEVGATTADGEGAEINIGGNDSVGEIGTTADINPIIEDGGGVSVDGGDGLGGDNGVTGGIEGVGGASVGGGDGFGGDESIGGEGIGDNGSPVEPIPLIPRWRLREILAHAEGECILLLCSVIIVCV